MGIVGSGFISYIKEDVIALILFWMALLYYIFYVITTYLSIKRQSQKLEAISEMTVMIFDENGVELYWDRPHESWPRKADGSIEMFTRPLDLENLLSSRII